MPSGPQIQGEPERAAPARLDEETPGSFPGKHLYLKNILHVSRLCLLLLLFPIVGAQISVKSETEDLVLLVVVAVIVV